MKLISDSKMKVKYLPPYTPQLNPIENVFGTIKARFRRLRVEDQVTTTNQLIGLVKRVFEEHYENRLDNYYRKMREYVDMGIKKLPFDKNL